jgi:hypothetical protein
MLCALRTVHCVLPSNVPSFSDPTWAGKWPGQKSPNNSKARNQDQRRSSNVKVIFPQQPEISSRKPLSHIISAIIPPIDSYALRTAPCALTTHCTLCTAYCVLPMPCALRTAYFLCPVHCALRTYYALRTSTLCVR